MFTVGTAVIDNRVFVDAKDMASYIRSEALKRPTKETKIILVEIADIVDTFVKDVLEK
jgi:hypothetical protein